MQCAVANRSGADDERAIRDGLGNGGEFPRAGEQVGSADGGTGFAECGVVGSDDAQTLHAKVAQGPGRGADVERIACAHEDDAQVVEFGCGGHGATL